MNWIAAHFIKSTPVDLTSINTTEKLPSYRFKEVYRLLAHPRELQEFDFSNDRELFDLVIKHAKRVYRNAVDELRTEATFGFPSIMDTEFNNIDDSDAFALYKRQQAIIMRDSECLFQKILNNLNVSTYNLHGVYKTLLGNDYVHWNLEDVDRDAISIRNDRDRCFVFRDYYNADPYYTLYKQSQNYHITDELWYKIQNHVYPLSSVYYQMNSPEQIWKKLIQESIDT